MFVIDWRRFCVKEFLCRGRRMWGDSVLYSLDIIILYIIKFGVGDF